MNRPPRYPGPEFKDPTQRPAAVAGLRQRLDAREGVIRLPLARIDRWYSDKTKGEKC